MEFGLRLGKVKAREKDGQDLPRAGLEAASSSETPQSSLQAPERAKQLGLAPIHSNSSSSASNYFTYVASENGSI